MSTRQEDAVIPGPHEQAAAHALLAAIAQMGLALRESQGPVAELGALFAHLAQTLTDLRATPTAAKGGTPPSAALPGSLEQLQSEVFRGIQQLQFYDRMVQNLSHLQDYLLGVAEELDSTKTRPQGQGAWDDLHAKLRQRLISDAQRGLLDLFLSPDTPTRVSAQDTCPDYSPPGTFEMF